MNFNEDLMDEVLDDYSYLQDQVSDLTQALDLCESTLFSLKAEIRSCFNFFEERGVITKAEALKYMEAYKVLPSLLNDRSQST